ncbi:MAG: DUF1554 domain-containing protein [Leptospiraceae bacterium]|nr:DUF1554 domain-containing protein [Leptospiraceae bacterium]
MRLSILFGLMAPLLLACDGALVKQIRDFRSNQAPVITKFSSNSPGGATLLPNQVFTINVEANDPEGKNITYKYSSEIGLFSGQSDSSGSSQVTFVLPNNLTPGFVANVQVTVTDEKKAATVQTLNLGSGKVGPAVTQVGSSNNSLKPSDSVSITWQTQSDGYYQIGVIDNDAATCQLDLNGALYIYNANTPVVTTVYGSLSANPLKLFAADGRDKLCIMVRDGLNQVGMLEIVMTADATAPVSSADIAAGSYSSVQSVTLSCVDSGAGCRKIAYTSNGSDPTFDANGNVTNGVEFSDKWDTPDTASTELRFAAMDNAGNVEAVQSRVYTINLAIPNISISNVTYDYVSTAGYTSTTFTWQSNTALTSFEVRSGSCASGTIHQSGGALAANTNQLSVINASSLPAGATTIYVCGTNAVGTGYATKGISRIDTVPAITFNGNGYDNMSTAGYTSSNLNWHANVAGTYTVRKGANCSATLLSGANASGSVNASSPLNTVVAASEITNLSNITVRVCFTSVAGVSNGASGSAYGTAIARNDTVPVVALSSNQYAFLSQNAGAYNSSNWTWNSTMAGNYRVYASGACGSGTQSSGGNNNGSVAAATNVTSVVQASQLSVGSNTARVCVTSIYGVVGQLTQAYTLDNTNPTFAGATSATANSSSQITLGWSAATEATSTPVSYEVCRSTTAGSCNSSFSVFATTASTGYINSGAASRTNYYYVVRARDAAGNREANTVQVSARTWCPASGTSSCFVFVTSGTLNGANGAADSDVLCNGDSNKPNTGVYKAVLHDGLARRACSTANCGGGAAENIDWAFRPSTLYRLSALTPVLTTNTSGIFVFGTLTNAFSSGANYYGTGLDADWTSAVNCSNWTSTSSGVTYRTGNPSGTNSSSVAWVGVEDTCNIARRRLCAEQ